MKSFEIGVKQTQVFFLHGLRGHGLAQETALQHIARQSGVNVVSLELPGHGASAQKMHCLVPPYQEIVERLCQEVKRHAVNAEQVVLMGYSFGATLMLLAAKALEEDPKFQAKVVGFIGLCTAFDVGHNVPKWQLKLCKIIAPLSRFFFEYAPVLSRILTIGKMDISLISAEKDLQESIAKDPLIYKGRIPLATSAQVYFTGLRAKEIINTASFTCLLLHSKDDKIALCPTADDFDRHVTVLLFDALRHNCIDGKSRESALARRAVAAFITEKL